MILNFIHISGCNNSHHNDEDPDTGEDNKTGDFEFLDLFTQDKIQNENCQDKDEKLLRNPIYFVISSMLENIISSSAKNI